jgi:hypothetical protein
MRALLVRGMLVGAVAGVLAMVFGYLVAEPSIGAAIDFEAAQHRLEGLPPDPEMFSRGVQSTFGLLTGTLIYGVAFGGLFSIAFAYAYGRIGVLSARMTAALVGQLGFMLVFLVPDLKYPSNPPSVGHPDTIGHRTGLYLLMMLLSVGFGVAAIHLGKRLQPRLGAWSAGLVAAGTFVVAVATAMVVLPGVNEVPGAFSASVLWHFRVGTIGTQLVMWSTLGLGFGALVERLETIRHREQAPAGS